MQSVGSDAPEKKAWGKPPRAPVQEVKQQQDAQKIDNKQPEVVSRGDQGKKKKKPSNNNNNNPNKKKDPKDLDKSHKEKENTDTNKTKLDAKDVSEKSGEGERREPEAPKKPAWKKDVPVTKVHFNKFYYNNTPLFTLGVALIECWNNYLDGCLFASKM